MSFIDDISEVLGEGIIKGGSDFRLVITGGECYMENVAGIRHYTEEEIALSLKKGGVIIRGEGLYIKKYCGGDIAVCGKVLSLEMV